ncbi:MAG: chemotaxis protein CheD [Coriobacteriia bacterium]|nr:chemotaxis protein CheD [Coriobacteriia bacterium]
MTGYDEHECRDLTDGFAVYVGTGKYVVASHPKVLVTQALGSCIGVTMFDPFRHTGGLAHVMLPSPADTAFQGTLDRFASYAVPRMAEMLSEGGARRRLVAKVIGGASMFTGDIRFTGIGDRNAEEVRRQLALLMIPVLAEDTGGSHARTVELHLDTGLVVVRSYLYGMKEL